jgi:hypothetical protein
MSELRTALEGHDESLQWRDFQGAVPKARPSREAAYTEARFDLNYGYDYDTEHATKGYRITEVHVRVTLERARMWVVTSAKTADLLQHEQGHYDIVALLSRDLFQELTGWNTAKPPKRFRKEIDLTGAAERLRRSTRALILQLDGSGRSVGVYDKQTNHGLDAKAQEEWNKALAAARSNGTRVMKGLSGLGVGGP